jgi:hypothetical protein
MLVDDGNHSGSGGSLRLIPRLLHPCRISCLAASVTTRHVYCVTVPQLY